MTRTDPDTNEDQSLWFENLRRGACLNVFAAFSDQMTSLVDFYALTRKCSIGKIAVKDIYKLAQRR